MSSGEVDVFSRLSQLIESHGPETGGGGNGRMNDAALDRLISSYIDDSNDRDRGYGGGYNNNNNNNNNNTSNNNMKKSGGTLGNSNSCGASGSIVAGVVGANKPTPYETWRARQTNVSVNFRQPKKLNEQQWDKLVGKMFKHSKLSQRTAVKDQNQGFAEELGGHDFKPKINKTSLNLSKTMKSIHIRLPEMLAEKRHDIEKKKEESDKREVAECTFKPTLESSKISDKINIKLAASRSKFLPNDLIKFKEDAEKRNQDRKMRIDEIDSKELTFKPKINTRSNEMHSKLVQENEDLTGSLLRYSALQQRSSSSAKDLNLSLDILHSDGLVAGTPFSIESDHPYKHNVSEYTKIKIQGAKRYMIVFEEGTCTENINDYVKFFRDDSHTGFWGAGKYCGGRQVPAEESGTSHAKSLANWPGLQGRSALVIKDSLFVIHFKTNKSVNDWGYKMIITPYFLEGVDIPQFTSADFSVAVDHGSSPQRSRPKTSSPIHNRLYQEGIESVTEKHNHIADLLQSKLNVPFRSWENARTADGQNNNAYSSQRSKSRGDSALSSSASAAAASAASSVPTKTERAMMDGHGVVNIILANQGEYRVNLVEFGDAVAPLWKILRTTSAMDQQL